ncbi:MAG: TRAP transporter substrate-binding protein DctP [Thermodesulfobacteriota bacterium]|nr:TRAP transporter substrate-binding protein DctP [Thermodesulfobacteriota bacterium]
MKRRTVFSVVLSFILVFAISSFALAGDKPIKIKLAHIAPPKPFNSPIHADAVAFKYILEKRSGGKFEVQIYPGGSLGKEVDLMEAVKNNVVQINFAAMPGLFRIYLPITVFFSPYIFRNEEIAMEVLQGPFGEKLLDDFTKETGIKALDYLAGYTYMAITNNKRAVESPGDMKGLKFRVMDPMGTAMFKSFGASAVPMAFSELYTSLQTGVIDGQTNPPFIVAWAKYDQVQKYLTMAKSQYGYQLIVCNMKWYDSLSSEDQKLLSDSLKAGLQAGNGLGLLLEDKALVDLTKAGMKVNTISEKDLINFQRIARPAGLAFVRKAMGDQMADGLSQAINAAEKKLGYR